MPILYLSHLNYRGETSWDLDLLSLESDAGGIKSPIQQVDKSASAFPRWSLRVGADAVCTCWPSCQSCDVSALSQQFTSTWHITHLCWSHMWHRYTVIHWYTGSTSLSSLNLCYHICHISFSSFHFLKIGILEPRRLIPDRVTFNSLLSACDGAGLTLCQNQVFYPGALFVTGKAQRDPFFN